MLAVRWTVGDVAERGFEALRCSLWGAWRLFGTGARYRVYVNTVSLAEARRRTGVVPDSVEWREAVELPRWLAPSLDPRLAEGVAWKFAPVRAFPEDHELALDNDVILWGRPQALDAWLAGAAEFVLSEDTSRYYGIFDAACPPGSLNTGIRGVAPGFDLEGALEKTLAGANSLLRREIDEQGLQVATLCASGRVEVVRVAEVAICSPFPPHVPELGECGAHFVGLNSRRLGFEFDGRAAEHVRAEHWDARVAEVRRRVGCA
jgi:hypothetical protein